MLDNSSKPFALHGTTILCLRKGEDVVIAADGQVSHGNTILKSTARKLRTMFNNNIIAVFAGYTSDALTLFEKLELKLKLLSNNNKNRSDCAHIITATSSFNFIFWWESVLY